MDELPMMPNDDDDDRFADRQKSYIIIYRKDKTSSEIKEIFMNDVAYQREKNIFKKDFPNEDFIKKDELYKAQGGYLYVKYMYEE
jgi:hypothetical protein